MELKEDQLNETALIEITRYWVNVLANENYDAVFNALGYAMAYQTPELSGAECIKSEIKNYRSEEYYPGVSNFSVSEWESTSGFGNPDPLMLIRFYKPNELKMIATIEFDFPLNGKWSDLEASFVVFETERKRFKLNFESIRSPYYEDSQ